MPWRIASQWIHRVSPAELETAPDAAAVARTLNDLVAPIGVTYHDNGANDARWRHLLAAEIWELPSFILRDIDALGQRLGYPPSEIFQLDQPLVHRAEPDAEKVLRRALELADHWRSTR